MKGREKRKIRREKIREKKESEGRRCRCAKTSENGEQLCFFQWFVVPEGPKVGSLKRRVRSQLARWEIKYCTRLWRETHFEVKMYKTHHARTTFGSWDVEKVHAVVARSTFRSENAQNFSVSDHFWTFRARFAWQAQGIVHLVKSKQNLRVLWHFQLQPPLHHTTLQYTTQQLQLHLHIPLHYTLLHPLHSTTHHYITLNYNNYTQLHYTTLHYTTLHYTTLHYTTFHYTTLHSTTLSYTTLRYTTLPSTTFHYITLHNTTTTTTLHYTPLQ